jgi:alpha-glucoside transport system permease protein
MGGPSQESVAVKGRRHTLLIALVFLLPALVLLGALVVYPIFFSVVRSLFDQAGSTYVGIRNYKTMFASEATQTAIKNTLIWVVFAPSIVTALGLIFAVLSERISWSTAFKVVIFMPMAVSFLSAGVTWRLIYEEDPHLGLANAAVQGVTNVFRSPGQYPDARPSEEQLLKPESGGFITTQTFSPGATAELGLIAIPPDLLPADAQVAAAPAPAPGAVAGTVWVDFTTGGGGEPGVVDPTEKGLPDVQVQAVQGDAVVGSASTGPNGQFVMPDLGEGAYQLRLPESNFRAPFNGFAWLGPTLVTPSIIVAYVWIWAGFAMVVIAAGLAAIPRDVIEASRVEGANEWQVFRRVTVPLLAPVLGVVLVTLIINVLKIFDLVLVIAPGSAQRTANVIALQMWKTAFGVRDFGVGSALAVFLFLLVIPAMAFNIRRFRAEPT